MKSKGSIPEILLRLRESSRQPATVLVRTWRSDATWIAVICFLSFLLAAWIVNSFAASVEVRPGQSINKKLDSLQPGDTLVVRAGTYSEGISLPRSGAPGKRIVIMAYPGERPLIATSETMLTLDEDYWLIKGLVFDHQGASRDAIKISGRNITLRNCVIRNGKRDAIDGDGGSENITIDNCVIHDFVWEPGRDAHGIVVSPGARRWKITNNTIYNCGGDCVQIYADDGTPVEDYAKDFTIAGNIFYTTLGDASENALDFKGMDGCLVDGNEMYGFENKAWVVQKGCRNITGSNNIIHDSQRGIEFRGEGGKSQENIRLIRNVLYNIRQYYAIKFDDVTNVEVLNNTLANISASSFRIEEQGIRGGMIRNNLIYDSGSAKVSGTFDCQSDHNGWFNANGSDMSGSGDVTANDPMFVNAANANFELRAGSPARDKGIDVGLPFTGSRPDLGAFEFSDASTPVELTSFSVAPFENALVLRWRTAFERSLRGFEIERRSNGSGFTKIAFVPAENRNRAGGEYEYVDRDADRGVHGYRLKQMDLDGSFSYSATVEILLGAPNTFSLHQNYPNPFNPVTTIQYDLPDNSQVQVAIYDMLGRKVRTLVSGFENAGFKAVQWQGRNDFGQPVGAGVYICQIRAGDFVQTRKMILLK